jgi:hypothetical protein
MKKMVTLAAALALLALSCGDEEGVTPQEPDRLAPTSPVNVLENVELAFNNRDVDLLKAMLSTNFIFYFDPDDVGQNPPGSHYVIPESWNRTEFLRAVSKMFKKAHRISLSIETENVGEPPPEAAKYKTGNVKAELLVMIDELNGYQGYGLSTFVFERYLAEGGGKCWRLTAWRDRGRYGDEELGAVEPSTIGRVLAIYYAI